MSKPVLQALLVADNVYQDRLTNKYIVCGIFNELASASAKEPGDDGLQADRNVNAVTDLPQKQETESFDKKIPLLKMRKVGSPFAYLNLTEVTGRTAFELRYVRLRDYTVQFSIGFEIASADPLQTIELSSPLPALPANEIGFFALELLWKDELLGSQRIRVRQIGEMS